jgi:predicted transcriptional regulator
MSERGERGRPVGRRYPRMKSVKLREIDAERLERLAEKLDRDQSWVIRHAIEALAKREKVAGGGD